MLQLNILICDSEESIVEIISKFIKEAIEDRYEIKLVSTI